METKNSLEEQVKALQRQMGGIAKLLKDLKSRVESLDKKDQESANKEIQEIIDAQTVMDEIIVANADAIKRMEKEIMEIFTKKAMDKVIGDVIEKESSENDKVIKVKKKCRYFNHGFCKYKFKCRYYHPDKICKQYLDTGVCEDKRCSDRHPKQCKWMGSRGGCKRQNECYFLHNEEENVIEKDYKCEGCKNKEQKLCCRACYPKQEVILLFELAM